VWEWTDGLKIVDGVAHIMTHNGLNTGYPGNSFAMAEADWKNTTADITAGLTSGNKILTLRTGDDWTGLGVCETSDATGSATYGNDGYWLDAAGERLSRRGGHWNIAAVAGVFALNLDNVRTLTSISVGFRLAFVTL